MKEMEMKKHERNERKGYERKSPGKTRELKGLNMQMKGNKPNLKGSSSHTSLTLKEQMAHGRLSFHLWRREILSCSSLWLLLVFMASH